VACWRCWALVLAPGEKLPVSTGHLAVFSASVGYDLRGVGAHSTRGALCFSGSWRAAAWGATLASSSPAWKSVTLASFSPAWGSGAFAGIHACVSVVGCGLRWPPAYSASGS
jgi:hypothetical protein